MKILFIDDDENLCNSIAIQIHEQNLEIDLLHDGLSGYDAAVSENYDLILLDRMLPDIDGIEVVKKLRKKHVVTPIILLTALSDINDRVEGLDAGADDYLIKPFAFEELMARIRTQTRRQKNVSDSAVLYGNTSYRQNGLVISTPKQEIQLTKREGSILNILLNNFNHTVSRSTLIEQAWGIETDITTGNLDNFIYFLRRHLEMADSTLEIETIRGVGFKIEERKNQ